MDFLQPLPAELAGNGVRRFRTNDDDRALRLLRGGINEQLVTAMGRVKLSDDKTQTVLHAVPAPLPRLRRHSRTPARHIPRKTA